MNRKECLDAAADAVLKDRNVTHGPPEDSLGNIASMWSSYLGKELSPHDVAAMMILFKVARIKTNPQHADSWVDAVGYAACGIEVVKPKAPNS